MYAFQYKKLVLKSCASPPLGGNTPTAFRLLLPTVFILLYSSEFVNMRDYSAPLCGRFFVLQDFCCPDIHPCGFLGAEIHPCRAGCADIQLADRFKIRCIAAVCRQGDGAGSIGDNQAAGLPVE